MQAYAKTDVGQVRKVNQDSVFISTTPVGPFPNLFIVADGMGGHKAGDYASRYAIETFLDYVKSTDSKMLIQVTGKAISAANRAVALEAERNPDMAGMGTTFVVAYIEENTLYAANVGDSRLYLLGSEISQVTEDHSYVATLVRAGQITEEEARFHPEKNVITRAVGVRMDVKPDFFEVDLMPEDVILMCTDGLTNMVEDQRLYELITQSEEADVTGLLIDEANRNGGTDNITAVVIMPEVKEVNEC